jgi:GTPase SAR1 family protein
MFRYSVKFLNHQCTIDTPFDFVKEWELYLLPFFEIGENGSTKSQFHFCLQANPDLVLHFFKNKLRNKANTVSLHCDLVGEKIYEENYQVILLVQEIESVYIIENTGVCYNIQYICKSFSNSIILDLLRLIRGVLIGLAQQDGMQKSHMAVVTLRKNAIAFLGNKGAGKTSFMIAFLKQFYQSSFLTNDKALLMLSPNKSITVFGLPYAIPIGFGTLDSCKEIPLGNETRIINNKAYFWPTQLVEQCLNRSVSPSSTLSSLVKVQINPTATELTYFEVTNFLQKKNIIEEIFIFSDEVTPHWLLNILGINPISSNYCMEHLMQKPLYQVCGNPWSEALKPLIERCCS